MDRGPARSIGNTGRWIALAGFGYAAFKGIQAATHGAVVGGLAVVFAALIAAGTTAVRIRADLDRRDDDRHGQK